MNMPRKLPGGMYRTVSVSVPKYERNFLTKIVKFVEEEYPDENVSWFFMMAVKHFINNHLTKDQKRRFRDFTFEVSGQEVPEPQDILKKIRSKKK